MHSFCATFCNVFLVYWRLKIISLLYFNYKDFDSKLPVTVYTIALLFQNLQLVDNKNSVEKTKLNITYIMSLTFAMHSGFLLHIQERFSGLRQISNEIIQQKIKVIYSGKEFKSTQGKIHSQWMLNMFSLGVVGKFSPSLKFFLQELQDKNYISQTLLFFNLGFQQCPVKICFYSHHGIIIQLTFACSKSTTETLQ